MSNEVEVSLNVDALTGAIGGSVKYAWSGSGSVPSTEDLDVGYAHALRLLTSVLMECHANAERVRLIAKERRVYFSPFYFDMSDALVPELCRVAPNPAMLRVLRTLIACLKRVDFFLRAAALSDPMGVNSSKALGFADDAVQKRVVDHYNTLVRVARDLNAALSLPDEFANVRPIDPDAEIDHSIL